MEAINLREREREGSRETDRVIRESERDRKKRETQRDREGGGSQKHIDTTRERQKAREKEIERWRKGDGKRDGTR